MSDPQPTDGIPRPASTDAAASRRRVLRMIAVVSAGSLVVASMIGGGVVARAAVLAEQQAEQQRVLALGALLDDRSAASELLASTSAVMTVLDEAPIEAEGSRVAAALVAEAHARAAAELQRPLDRSTATTFVKSQQALLAAAIVDLVVALDDATRAVLAAGRDALEASPLAPESDRAALRSALDRIAVVPQGLPSSYTGRAALLDGALDAAQTARTSHAEEKAERERRAAEKRAAEEAAARAGSGGGGGSRRPSLMDAAERARMLAEGCVIVRETADMIVWDCPPEYFDSMRAG
jgi:hypothetical protein